MARKFLYLVAALIVLVIAAMFVLRIWSLELTRYAFVPHGKFERVAPLAPQAWDEPGMWVSRPGTPDDPAQWLPEGAHHGAPVGAWVFFVHPTSYLARDHWNGPLDDKDTNGRAGLFVHIMGSAFNDAAALWVPRYRQAAFGSFLVQRPESREALDAAYGDIEAAFATFLAHVPPGAPIVIAGHSQGSQHVLHLLRDKVRGTPLADRVAAVYAIGWPVSPDHDLPALGLPACDRPDQAGCVASWLSFAEPGDPKLLLDAYHAEPGLDGQPRGSAPVLCTNPLTGKRGGSAPAAANLGTLVPAGDMKSGRIVPGAVGARCDSRGLLLIGEGPDLGPYVLPGNNYHVYDIPLFWTNLRADLARRVAAWSKVHPVQKATAQ